VLQACELQPRRRTTLDRVTSPDPAPADLPFKGAPLLLAAGLFDRELYELQVGRRFPDELAAAWDYLRGGQAGTLLPHPLLDPLLLPSKVRSGLAAARVRVLVDHLRGEGRSAVVSAELDLSEVDADPAAQAAHLGGALGLFLESGAALPDGRSFAEVRDTLFELIRTPVPADEQVVDWASLRETVDRRVSGRVSVVIPTWNDEVMTSRAVDRVLAHSDGIDVEVVVVDNGSRRDLGARLAATYSSEQRVRVERMPRNLNFALGSNVGFARSTGATMVFLNNDTEVHDGWLPPLLQHLDDPTVQGVQPLLLYPDGTIQAAGTVFPLDDTLPCHFLVGEPAERAAGLAEQRFSVVTAAALAMRAADVARLEGFDPVFVNGMEDVDLCLRAATEPAFVVEPASVVTHHESKTPGRGAHIPANRAELMARWSARLPMAEPERWTAQGLQIDAIDLDKLDVPSPRVTVRPRVVGTSRLLLHVGMSKTGSSALQVAFVRERELLARHGWAYPAAESDDLAGAGGVTSGNGVPLARWLVPGLAPEGADPGRVQERALAALRRHAGEQVLLSSEFLWQLEAGALARFVRQAEALGYQVEAVGYVRDIAGHALSEYSQRVKRHLLTASFGDFCRGAGGERYEAGMRGWITTLRSVLGDRAVRVHHYDSHRRDLTRHFFSDVLGLDAPAEAAAVVNRSLTPAEIEVMREVNARVSSRRAGRLASDTLLGRPPLGDPAVSVTVSELAVLEGRFADEVAWINEQALAEPRLSVRGDIAVRPDSDAGRDRTATVALATELAELAEAQAAAG